MTNINAAIRLRPIRFTFLVDPSDEISLQKVFEVNTALWGGLFNLVIPYFAKTPDNWDHHPHENKLSPLDIRKGYIDFFEPDFIVETSSGQAEGLSTSDDLVINIDDILLKSGEYGYKESYGLNMFDVYKSLYQSEFKYERRHEHHIMCVKSNSPEDNLFVACLWGGFPTDDGFEYIQNGFEDAISPKHIVLSKDTVLDVYKAHNISAIDLTTEKTKPFYDDNWHPKLYVFDSNNVLDVIDLWNLRVCEKNFLAIPIHLLGNLQSVIDGYIEKNHVSLKGNSNGIMISTTVIFSRSIEQDAAQELFKKHVKKHLKEAATCQLGIPAMWDCNSAALNNFNKPILSTKEKTVQIKIQKSEKYISFEGQSPDFADKYGGNFRWANVIQLSDYRSVTSFPMCYPNNRSNVDFPNLSNGDFVLTNREGIILFPKFKDSSEFWNVKMGHELFIHWLKLKNIQAEISNPAGKTVLKMVKALGGINGFDYLASPDLIKQINDMARRVRRQNTSQSSEIIEYPEKTIHFSALTQKLHEFSYFNEHWKKNWLENLIQHKVLKLGLEIKCSECDAMNWYTLDDTSDTLTCEHCLDTFSFPLAQPANKYVNYAYKAIGPFSRPNFSDGAYTVGLTIRFFANVISCMADSKITWSPSLTLTHEKENLESDFLLWYQYKISHRRYSETDIIFGECKSFGAECFTEIDIDRMKRLSELIPGSVLVFSTLKEELSNKEKILLSELALWGREEIDNETTRAPVIILTGLELFTLMSLQDSWKKKGGKHAELIGCAYHAIRLKNPRKLANFTQQLYLDLPSYFEWFQARLNKKEC